MRGHVSQQWLRTFKMKEPITEKLKKKSKKIVEAIYDLINQLSHSGPNLEDLGFISCAHGLRTHDG